MHSPMSDVQVTEVASRDAAQQRTVADISYGPTCCVHRNWNQLREWIARLAFTNSCSSWLKLFIFPKLTAAEAFVEERRAGVGMHHRLIYERTF